MVGGQWVVQDARHKDEEPVHHNYVGAVRALMA
jgi:hypothetical protein